MKQKLGLKEGFPIAMGSIIGSGILFLPSLTYKIAGEDVLYVWLIATLACVPLIPIFNDMASRVENSSGIKGYIELALGSRIGKIIPILFLATVSLGMPSAAYIAMQYLGEYLGLGLLTQKLLALALIESCVLVVVFGLKLSARVQSVVTATLILLTIFFIITLGDDVAHNFSLKPPAGDYGKLFKGITVAFWAYAGFENLSFLSSEFKNPKRDLSLSISLALLVSGLIYLFLSVAYASLVPDNSTGNLASLYDMANFVPMSEYMRLGIVVFAVAAVSLNLLSWSSGISRMIYDSARSKILPSQLSKLNKDGEPVNAVLFLGFLFLMSNIVMLIFPGLFEHILVAVSANFVFIYVLAVFSFLKLNLGKMNLAWIFAAILFVFFISAFLSSDYSIIYTLSIFVTAFCGFHLIDRRES